jgi:hypothetical protein
VQLLVHRHLELLLLLLVAPLLPLLVHRHLELLVALHLLPQVDLLPLVQVMFLLDLLVLLHLEPLVVHPVLLLLDLHLQAPVDLLLEVLVPRHQMFQAAPLRILLAQAPVPLLLELRLAALVPLLVLRRPRRQQHHQRCRWHRRTATCTLLHRLLNPSALTRMVMLWNQLCRCHQILLSSMANMALMSCLILLSNWNSKLA